MSQREMSRRKGFTLLEMMVVIAIISILALMAVPRMDPAITRRQVVESVALIERYQQQLALHYAMTGQLYQNNKEAMMPPADKLLGNYVDGIELDKGVFHVHFGNKAHLSLKGKILSLQPLVVIGSPESPMSWRCGHSGVPEGMQAIGDNRTEVAAKDLPFHCRY